MCVSFIPIWKWKIFLKNSSQYSQTKEILIYPYHMRVAPKVSHMKCLAPIGHWCGAQSRLTWKGNKIQIPIFLKKKKKESQLCPNHTSVAPNVRYIVVKSLSLMGHWYAFIIVAWQPNFYQIHDETTKVFFFRIKKPWWWRPNKIGTRFYFVSDFILFPPFSIENRKYS